MARQQDISKLPVWGREIIGELTRENEDLRQRLAEAERAVSGDPGDANVIADPYVRNMAIGRNVTVRFLVPGYKPGDAYVDLDLQDNGLLHVNASGRRSSLISVLPYASNDLFLRWEPAR